MDTIKWQNDNFFFEDQNEAPQGPELVFTEMVVEEKQDGEAIQLRKFEDPSKNQVRQSHIALLEKFGALLLNGELHQIAQDLLTEDFEVFIFSSAEKAGSRHAKGTQEFIDLYKTLQIQERFIRETDIDLNKDTACQICSYKINHEGEAISRDEVWFEIFSIRNGKISKYRASYGDPFLEEQVEDPLEPTRKDRMLAKVKRINYALAGQPDLLKVESLLDENTEYKICRWDDLKCFTMYKREFVPFFRSLEENMSVKSIVPYELSTDSEEKYVNANYVYHLEDNRTGDKFVWLSTCIYEFDHDIKISQIIQQGELYPDGEVDIPFEVENRNEFEKKFGEFHSIDMLPYEYLYSENILFNCSFWTVCSLCKPKFYYYHGLKQLDVLTQKMEYMKDIKILFNAPVDIFVDHSAEGYDVVFGLLYFNANGIKPEFDIGQDITDMVCFVRLAFENGKLVKALKFIAGLLSPIESPFDDKTFRSSYLK